MFSTSYNPSSFRRRFQGGRDETRLPQDDSSSNRSPRFSFPEPQRHPTASTTRSFDRRHVEQGPEKDLDDVLEQVIMAIDIKEHGTVGCCYYVAQEEKLYILGDVQLGGKEIIETCFFP